jgi:hypothetical protein
MPDARRGKSHVRLGAVAIAVTITACSDIGSPETEFRGRYIHAFESSAFLACGGSENWWAAFEARHPTLDSAIAVERAPEYRTDVYLEVRGRLSKPGHYGHLGASTRELTVQEIMEVRAWDPNACQ